MKIVNARSLLLNLLLSAGVFVLLLGALEGVSRLTEKPGAAPAVADYIWDWQKQWDGDFYTVSSDAVGWPPWEEFNADGLRDRTHAVEKLPRTLRLAVLGDSVAMGAGLAAREAFPRVLEERLAADWRRVEVFDVALWGWSTHQERIAYRRLVRKYAPDEVLLAVCLNDIPELQNNLSRPPRLIEALYERSALVRRVVDAQGREIRSVEELFSRPESSQVRAGYGRFFAEVRALSREVRADGATLALLVLPFRFQVGRDAPLPLAQDEIRRFCAREGLACLDLLPRLRRAGPAAFLDYDHLSALGSRLAAEEIAASGLLQAGPSGAEILSGALGGSGAAVAGWLGRPETPAPPPAIADLAGLLRDPDPAVREAACRGLERAGPSARSAVPVLVKALGQDGDAAVRASAAGALGALGPGAAAAVPALLDRLDDSSESVRGAAARALSQIGLAESEVPRLVAALDSPDAYVRGFAAWSLGELGPAASPAVPALVRALTHDEAYGRGGAAEALGKMGAAAGAAVPALLQGLASSEEGRRWRAARALGRIGPAAAGAVAALTRALADPSDRVRFHAARALGRLGRAAEPAVAALTRATGDPDRGVRHEAEKALRKIAGA